MIIYDSVQDGIQRLLGNTVSSNEYYVMIGDSYCIWTASELYLNSIWTVSEQWHSFQIASMIVYMMVSNICYCDPYNSEIKSILKNIKANITGIISF